ncbi:fungal specific transcription factor domain-containing protein [Neofusicoccum parvum]|uniref:Fungal specific transcription factor domain-containing protein n=1 Tax=Neofusicoccum parvum TaxID=310453 RepID=A0ACB5SL42_9PEZI|nr:fungal specific transcription factor domain-containing protein [Neofusicoccum parvum]
MTQRVARSADFAIASHVQRLQDRVHELEDTLRQYRTSSPTHRSSSQTELRSDNGSQQPSASDGPAGRGTMVVEDTGELRYFGPSSSISILSPDGLQWLEARTADASLRQRLELPLNGGGSWSKWTHPLLQSLWPTTNSTPLPSWEDAQALVNDFFENYNTVLPIFHPPTFMALLGRQYARSSNVVEDPAWSAALNAVLAMAQRRRAEQAPQTRELADCAWAYARNALELILAVHMRSVSLLSVQATVALAWFFRGTPNPQPLFFLTAAAVRLSHSAGLHRGADHLPLSQTDREQRLRVFWIALILDSSASLRTGRPCTHSINDIGVRLPSGSPKDNLGIIVNRQGTAVLNFLLVKAQFSVLEAKIYDRVFASDSSKKSTEALAADVRDLGQELDEWSRVVPGGTNTDNIADNWDHQHPHIVSLLLAYHSCVITVHSATWQRHFTSVRGRRFSRQDFDVSSRGFPHAAKCLHAAHEIVKFLSFVPQESTSFIW